MKPTLLPPALAKDLSMRALEAVNARLSEIDIRPGIIYDFEHVATSALPHLAEQFHVLGVEGWQLATTDEQRRALLARAIALHRYKGTPWAVESVLAAYGYPECELVEHRQLHQQWLDAGGGLLNGDGYLDGDGDLSAPSGSFRFTTTSWAEYALRLNAVDGVTTTAMLRQIEEICAAFAPARSRLAAILLFAAFEFQAIPHLVSVTSRGRVLLNHCRRVVVAPFETLDGCGLIDGDTVPAYLNGDGYLDGEGFLVPENYIGEPLDGGQLGIKLKLRTRTSGTALGGNRAEAPEFLNDTGFLDGGGVIAGECIDGYGLLDGAGTLYYPTLVDGDGTLDGTTNLGEVPGPANIWFSGWMRTRRGSTIVMEPL